MSIYTDSDRGRCVRTRRFHSGGCIPFGGHLVAHWSRTQQTVAPSSCEAEVNGINKGATEGIGVRNMLECCGFILPVVLCTDASAAKGRVEMHGAGKVKHLSIKQLWAQGLVARGLLKVFKIPREANISDVLTHHWSQGQRCLIFSGHGRGAAGCNVLSIGEHQAEGAS